MKFKNDPAYQEITKAMEREKRLYPKDLVGLSYRQLRKPRGLPGGTYGAAGPCRTLTAEERLAIASRLIEDGVI